VSAGALAFPAAAADPALELARRYAPVVRLVKQEAPCKPGEAYEPTDVNLVLGNPDVALRGPWSGQPIVKIAPTAHELSAGLFGYHLDFPGKALKPGCDYDKWSHLLTAGTQPRTYAHIATDPAHPGQLALQYWFFYLFNDFNDKHEGDWEMIQLDFRADSPVQALETKPTEVGYSQHEGAERATWGDKKLQIVDGTHPVVYPGSGSHANYYSSSLFLGRSAAEGVGCDDTQDASRVLRPAVSLVPTDQAAYLESYPWLGYVGGWGEEHPGFYGGPTGPNTKAQWTQPITWADTSWRDSAFTIPGTRGNAVTDFFCGAVAKGSSILTLLVASPTLVIVTVTVLLLILLWLGTRTRWDVTAPFRLARRRPWGSLITTGFHLYWENLRLFLGIGLLFVPLGVLIGGVQYLLFRVGAFGPLVESAGTTNGFVAGLAFGLGLFFTIMGLNIVTAVVAVAVVALDQGEEITPWDAYRRTLPRLGRLLLALLIATVVIAVLALTGFGFLIGVFLLVRWSMLAQTAALGEDHRRLLQQSAKLVRGHWWRVGSITLFVTAFTLLLGPLLGTILLLITSASFNVVNLVSALVYTVTVPFVAIVTTYLYFDLTVRWTLDAELVDETRILPAEI